MSVLRNRRLLAKRRVGHACIRPRMDTGRPILDLYPPPRKKLALPRPKIENFPLKTVVSDIRTLSISKIKKKSGQNGFFSSPFFLSRRSRLSRTTMDPSRQIRRYARSIAIGDPNSRWRLSTWLLAMFCSNIAKKKFLSDPRSIVLIYTPKEAHSRILWPGGQYSRDKRGA